MVNRKLLCVLAILDSQFATKVWLHSVSNATVSRKQWLTAVLRRYSTRFWSGPLGATVPPSYFSDHSPRAQLQCPGQSEFSSFRWDVTLPSSRHRYRFQLYLSFFPLNFHTPRICTLSSESYESMLTGVYSMQVRMKTEQKYPEPNRIVFYI